MNVALVGLRLARPLSPPAGPADQRLTTVHIDIVPLALVSTPYTSLRGGSATDCDPDALCLEPGTSERGLFPNGSALGLGIAPLGITTHFRRAERVSPSIGITGGTLLFDRAVPTTGASPFNLTATIETAVRIGDPDRTGIVLAYRFHHISNASFARENPGIASHLLTIGLRSARVTSSGGSKRVSRR